MALTAAERKRQETARQRADKQNKLAAEAKRKQAELDKAQKDQRDKLISGLRSREDKARTTANTKSQNAEIEQARRRGEVADIHGGGKAAKAKMEAEIAAIRKKYEAGITPAAKPAPKPAAKPKPTVADYSDAQGNVYDGNTGALKVAAPQRRSPAIGAPVHASPSAFGSAPKLQQQSVSPYVGSSAATPPRPSSPAQAALAGAPASETYRDGGKGLYQGTQAYRDAVGGSGNPLLNRFRSGMGLDPATGAKPQQEGQPQQAPTAANAEPKMSAQYDGNDEPGRLGQAENPMKSLMDLLNRRKLSISVEN
jgi:hypothetical protein